MVKEKFNANNISRYDKVELLKIKRNVDEAYSKLFSIKQKYGVSNISEIQSTLSLNIIRNMCIDLEEELGRYVDKIVELDID